MHRSCTGRAAVARGMSVLQFWRFEFGQIAPSSPRRLCAARGLDLNAPWGTFDADAALSLFAADWATRNGEAAQVFGERFHAKGDRRLGFYTLLAAGGMSFHPQISYQWNQTRVTLDIEAETYKSDQMGFNVVGEIPGTTKKDEIVMLGGHLDSWQGGTGATDNGTGSSVAIGATRL